MVFTSAYYIYFVRQFLTGEIVMGGDTQLLWSLNYLAIHSLLRSGEFLWWDPTALNGWPAYVNLISGWFNYFSPYTIASLLLLHLSSLFFDVSINAYLVVQKTLLPFALNLTALVLTSRELIANRYARLLPPLLFTFGEIQFHGFGASVLYEAMPGPLFFVFSLVYFNNRRTPRALLMLLIFSGLMLASLNYGVLQTSFWWVSMFVLFLSLLNPSLVAATYRAGVHLYHEPRGRLVALLGGLFLLTALLAFYLPIHFNLGNLVRVEGAGAIDYATGSGGDFSSAQTAAAITGRHQSFYALSHPIWTNFLYWAPMDAIHDVFLRFDDKGGGARSGVDQRYIGLVTLPLLFAALILRFRNPYVMALFLSAFTCSAFVTYTARNLLISALAETFEPFKNVRTIADTLPRDGPSIFLIIASGMGLDALLRRESPGGNTYREYLRLLRMVLCGLLALGALCIALSFAPIGPLIDTKIMGRFHFLNSVLLGRLKEAFAHAGVYLSLFVLLCLLLATARGSRNRKPLAITLLALTFMDLTISSTAYWQRGLVWFDNSGPHALPNPRRIGPVDTALQTWPGSYGGFIHNAFAGPFIGVKSWLVLASRPTWQPALENWNPAIRIMTAYPDFRFYTRATYIPFDRIRDIDHVAVPSSPAFYLHDERLTKASGAAPERLDARLQVLAFAPNRVRVRTSMPKDGFMVFLDNYDRFWSARVDGATTPVHRANFTFKAIALPAGEHIVDWSYNPYPVKVAWVLFYLAFAAMIAAIAGLRMSRAALLIAAMAVVLLGGQHVAVRRVGARGLPHATDTTPDFSAGTRVEHQEGRAVLRTEDNRGFVVSNGLAGSLEGVWLDQFGMVTVRGWAIDESATAPAWAVVVTIGDRLWITGYPSLDRPDIAALNPGYRRSGLTIFGRGADARDLGNLRAYAILRNGTARELLYAPGLKHGAPGRP